MIDMVKVMNEHYRWQMAMTTVWMKDMICEFIWIEIIDMRDKDQ